ncbi:MAG: GtrA family protein [Myxococcaceae bacterium]|nr:GtrA family protein [Myxococcaceae bacterium]
MRELVSGWAVKSLLVGAVATGIDLCIGSGLVFVLGWPTAAAAMAGLGVGSTLNFLGQRRFAFNAEKVAMPAVKWAAMTAVQTVVHGQLAHLLRDGWGAPYPVAKLVSDFVVFGALQLLLLRYVVFPKEPVTGIFSARAPSSSRLGWLRKSSLSLSHDSAHDVRYASVSGSSRR